MNWNIKDHGDGLEKKSQSLISSRVPTYKEFWRLYVGNINGNPASINGISEELNHKRLLVAQWNYSILRNTYAIKTTIIGRHKKISNVDSMIEQEVKFLTSTHLFYNTIEIAQKIQIQLEEPSSNQKFQNFIKFRNCITHNIKPLTKVVNDYYHVPSNFEWFEEKSIKSDESWIWSEEDFSGLKYQTVDNYFEYCYEESINLLNQVLENELDYFSKLFPNLEISDPIPESRNEFTRLPPSSDVTIE